MFKTVRGTKDILPAETPAWQCIEEKSRRIFSAYGYKELRTPILEESNLFKRSLGEHTEIVEKQMFVIKRDSDSFALRPEATAGIVRAYLENNLDKTDGFIKVYYIGPMFRAERPQKGRLRQFHHIGCEAIGSNSPFLDAEIISLGDQILKELKITGYKIRMNNLGCLEDKAKFSMELKKRLKDITPKLCEDCQDRYNRNVFRVLDCKNQDCRNTIHKLSIGQEHLCHECLEFSNGVKEKLNSLKVDYAIDPFLIRGLDYYTRTVFEITHTSLGSQDALGAGGRYDNLVKELGGQNQGAIGFAFGVERLLLVSTQEEIKTDPVVYLVTLNNAAKDRGFVLLNQLRNTYITSDFDYSDKSLKAQMRQADKLKAKFVAILGEDELNKNVITLKDMQTSQQKQISLENFIPEIKNLLSR